MDIDNFVRTQPRILVIDDEPSNIQLLRYILKSEGYSGEMTTSDSREVMGLFEVYQPDLILLDLMMPHLSGYEIMHLLKARIAPGDCIPILVLTADINIDSKHLALRAGAMDFLTKPFDPVEVRLRIRNLLQIRSQHKLLRQHNATLEDVVAQKTSDLQASLTSLEESMHDLCNAQHQVIQHERMSALGSMAAGLAHDFNNALSLILGYSELLQVELSGRDAGGYTQEFLETIIDASQNAAKMFRRLRTFHRGDEDDPEHGSLDLNRTVEHTIALTRPRWHGQALADGVTINVVAHLDANLPELLGDAAELGEMLTNLIFNAVDAMPKGGTISIASRFEPPAEDDHHAAGEIILELQDTGVGMDATTARRCLEPFFTTKGERGTGLGLAMVYGTMQRHRGHIELESEPGKGTCFRLHLPLRTNELPATRHLPALSPGSYRILIVDDEKIFAEFLCHLLSLDGHHAEMAQSGAEALAKIDQAGENSFDLVITDQAMPGVRGQELAISIKELFPRTRVMILTGMSTLHGRRWHEAVDVALFKPISHAQLKAAVNALMAKPDVVNEPLHLVCSDKG